MCVVPLFGHWTDNFPRLTERLLKSIYHVLSCSGHVPIALYKTDFKLIFILIAIYTSVVAQFRQTANQEADRDVDSGLTFMINEEWANESISGGVSDRILWNCRPHSRTHTYYKLLYLGLIISYLWVVVVYFLAQVLITVISLRLAQALRYKYDNKTVYILEVAANAFKTINQNLTELEEAKISFVKSKASKAKRDVLDNKIKTVIKNSKKKWEYLTTHDHKESYIYNWCIVLYIIPRIETLIMLLLLTFSVTSYDPHPFACLSPIDIFYNETQFTVTLKISQTVIDYQQASVLISVGIAIFWLVIKLWQYIMLPRAAWGFVIKKDSKGCAGGWSVQFESCKCGSSCLSRLRNCCKSGKSCLLSSLCCKWRKSCCSIEKTRKYHCDDNDPTSTV